MGMSVVNHETQQMMSCVRVQTKRTHKKRINFSLAGKSFSFFFVFLSQTERMMGARNTRDAPLSHTLSQTHTH